MGPLYSPARVSGRAPRGSGRQQLEGAQPKPASPDPLGVRGDFPAAEEVLYLDSAYITPTPTPVVDAGKAFAESKGRRPIPLGDMLQRTNQVRAHTRA